MKVPGFAGVDGCRGGWIAVLHLDEGAPRVALRGSFADIVGMLPDDAAIAVDMPIGLPERIGAGGRGPEKAVRPFLGERQSSVFAIPARPAVFAETYQDACRIALETSDPPRKVSKQAFHIFPRIRELDGLLRGAPRLMEWVIEVHPEFAFWRLNGERAMTLPKKIRGSVNPAGIAERAALLQRCGYSHDFLLQRPPRGAAADDLIDAAGIALIAKRFLKGRARPFPAPLRRDMHGLPVAIWA